MTGRIGTESFRARQIRTRGIRVEQIRTGTLRAGQIRSVEAIVSLSIRDVARSETWGALLQL